MLPEQTQLEKVNNTLWLQCYRLVDRTCCILTCCREVGVWEIWIFSNELRSQWVIILLVLSVHSAWAMCTVTVVAPNTVPSQLEGAWGHPRFSPRHTSFFCVWLIGSSDVSVNACLNLSVSMWQTSDLSTLYPASNPVTVKTDSSITETLNSNKAVKVLDGSKEFMPQRSTWATWATFTWANCILCHNPIYNSLESRVCPPDEWKLNIYYLLISDHDAADSQRKYLVVLLHNHLYLLPHLLHLWSFIWCWTGSVQQ